MKRYGSVIKVRPEAIAEYKRYHAAVWPAVLDMIRKCNIPQLFHLSEGRFSLCLF